MLKGELVQFADSSGGLKKKMRTSRIIRMQITMGFRFGIFCLFLTTLIFMKYTT